MEQGWGCSFFTRLQEHRSHRLVFPETTALALVTASFPPSFGLGVVVTASSVSMPQPFSWFPWCCQQR